MIDDPAAVPSQTSLIVGTIAAVVTSVVTFLTIVYNGWQANRREERQNEREARQRQWLLQDKANAAAEREAQTAGLHKAIMANTSTTEAAAAAAAAAQSAVADARVELKAAIADNTVKTEAGIQFAKDAIVEANGVTKKLEAIGQRVSDIARRTVSPKKGDGSTPPDSGSR